MDEQAPQVHQVYDGFSARARTQTPIPRHLLAAQVQAWAAAVVWEGPGVAGATLGVCDRLAPHWSDWGLGGTQAAARRGPQCRCRRCTLSCVRTHARGTRRLLVRSQTTKSRPASGPTPIASRLRLRLRQCRAPHLAPALFRGAQGRVRN
jgi:hypothetical protein